MAPGGISIPLLPVHGLTYRVDGRAAESIDVTPGMVLINGSREMTWLRWESPLECIRVQLSSERLARLEDFSWFGTESVYVVHDSMMQHIAELLKDSIHDGEAGGCVFAQSVGATLIAHIERRYGSEGWQSTAGAGDRLSSGVLGRIRDMIEERLAEPMRLKELADAANMSEFHFLRAFKRLTGLAPHQYITSRRMERAQLLLNTSELPIAEVAWLVGFSNTSHFTVQFRKHSGTTPANWRDNSKRGTLLTRLA
jgi:AraC family transcriptional regulator